MSQRSRSTRHLGLVLAVAVAVVVTAMSLSVGPAGRGAAPVAASNASSASSGAAAQAAQCVTATNFEHAEAERAYEFLILAFARGSFDFLGLSWSTTSLQEDPAGTWTQVESCDGPGTTTTTMPGTTTTTMPGTTTTTAPSTTTTTAPTTTTTGPPADGAALFSANCAACHGADGSGGAGPDLRGIGEMHTIDELIEVITNGRAGMPAWRDELSAEEIRAVAQFVSEIPGEGHEHDHAAAN